MTKKKVTKKEIVRHISEKFTTEDFKLTQLLAKDIVQEVLNEIVQALLTQKRIELRKFGVFEVKRRKPRKARNPLTDETVEVPAKNVVTFKPGKDMEDQVLELKDVPLLEEELTGTEKAENNGAPPKKPRKKATPKSRKTQPAKTE